jgi:hypothetical protein
MPADTPAGFSGVARAARTVAVCGRSDELPKCFKRLSRIPSPSASTDVRPVLRLAARWAPIFICALCVSFAINSLVWLHGLPRSSSGRYCGNCFLAAIGVPIELGLLAVLWTLASVLNIRWRGTNAVYWCCALVGILLTPVALGFPLFVFSALALTWSIAKPAVKRVLALHPPRRKRRPQRRRQLLPAACSPAYGTSIASSMSSVSAPSPR